jgi:hypothetical protein
MSADCLHELASTVVVNPRHPGNGGSLVQAANAGIPVALLKGNDAEVVLPPTTFVSSVSELVDRVTELLESGRARRRALRQTTDHEARQDRESRSTVARLISWNTFTEPDT